MEEVSISGNTTLYPGVLAEYTCRATQASSLVWSLHYEDGEDVTYYKVKNLEDAIGQTSVISFKASSNHNTIEIACRAQNSVVGAQWSMIVNIESKQLKICS